MKNFKKDPKLSLLIFSKNDTDNALGLAKSLLDIFDQIVIVDSSDEKEHKELVEKAKRYHKIEVYYALPLGYADPLRQYGISKCKNEWILYLDTDERINYQFKKDLKNIIKRSNINGYWINRITIQQGSKKIVSRYTDNQLRLYKRSKVTYKGYIHEFPKIKGKTSLLNNKYIIKQIHSSIIQFKKQTYRYIPIEIYENRLSYARIIYGTKSIFTKFLARLLSVGKNQEYELSKLDYIIYTIWGLFYSIIHSFFKAKTIEPFVFQNFMYNLQKIDYLFSLKDYQLRQTFLISQQIRRAGGVIKYLGLDNPKIVNNLKNKCDDIQSWKYLIPLATNVSDDIKCFIKLLEEKYYISKNNKSTQ